MWIRNQILQTQRSVPRSPGRCCGLCCDKGLHFALANILSTRGKNLRTSCPKIKGSLFNRGFFSKKFETCNTFSVNAINVNTRSYSANINTDRNANIKSGGEMSSRDINVLLDDTKIGVPNETFVKQDLTMLPIEELLLQRRKQDYMEMYPDRDVKEFERYLPSSDPYAFLIEDSKLTEKERIWQKIFVALPWVVFVAMVCTPFVLVHSCSAYLTGRTPVRDDNHDDDHVMTHDLANDDKSARNNTNVTNILLYYYLN